MQTNAVQKFMEEALFDNRLAQEFLAIGKTQELTRYLEANELRLCSGMTAEQIDAVTKRASEACKRLTR